MHIEIKSYIEPELHAIFTRSDGEEFDVYISIEHMFTVDVPKGHPSSYQEIISLHDFFTKRPLRIVEDKLFNFDNDHTWVPVPESVQQAYNEYIAEKELLGENK